MRDRHPLVAESIHRANIAPLYAFERSKPVLCARVGLSRPRNLSARGFAGNSRCVPPRQAARELALPAHVRLRRQSSILGVHAPHRWTFEPLERPRTCESSFGSSENADFPQFYCVDAIPRPRSWFGPKSKFAK